MKIGTIMLRVFPQKDITLLTEQLRSKGFGVTVVDTIGKDGDNQMCFSVMDRKSIPEVIGIINSYNPNAFYTIEDIRSVTEGFKKIPIKNKSVFRHPNPSRRMGK